MKIKFTGMMQEVESGCVPCGRSAGSKMAFVTSRDVILPSGQTKTFHRNEVVEVNATDGEWLLSWIERDPSGMERHVFEKAE